jgi:hypothetical protein
MFLSVNKKNLNSVHGSKSANYLIIGYAKANGRIGNPNHPAMPIKCDPKSSTYGCCIEQTKPEPKCKSNGVYSRCPGLEINHRSYNPICFVGAIFHDFFEAITLVSRSRNLRNELL